MMLFRLSLKKHNLADSNNSWFMIHKCAILWLLFVSSKVLLSFIFVPLHWKFSEWIWYIKMSSKRDNHPMELSRPVPTFCDVCNKIAFGLLLQCSNCKLICHKACQSKILFHCQSDLERTLQSGRQKVRTDFSLRIY